MKTYLLVTSLLASLFAGNTSLAHHEDGFRRESLVSYSIDIRPGESQTINVPGGWRQVRKLYVTAQAYYGDATLQVTANGDEKARFFIPKVDPYYVVNIDETTSQLVLTNYRGNGTIRVTKLEADLSFVQLEPIGPSTPNTDPISFHALNEAAQFARRAITLADSLRPYADPETEYIVYLLPIRRVAGRALALANARGNGSIHVRHALQALAQQIEFADKYINSTLKKEIPYELAVELLSLKDAIRDWLE